jgi:hypothetical protein
VRLRVRCPGLARWDDDERLRRRAAAESTLLRIRTRMFGEPTSAIQAALVDGPSRATTGHVAEEDLAMAAAAVHRGNFLVVDLTS